jgi:hypothetical protein
VWKDRVLRKTNWPERKKVIGEGCIMRRLHNEELHNEELHNEKAA